MMCMRGYEIKPPIYEKFLEEYKFARNNNRLENGLKYLY